MLTWLIVNFIYTKFVVFSFFNYIDHGSPNGGPRAAYGPRTNFIRPAYGPQTKNKTHTYYDNILCAIVVNYYFC